jgi:acyl carrier protein
MSEVATGAKLADVFRRALDIPSDVDVTTLAYGKDERWDSIGHMVLVAEIEDAYGVLLDTEDVIGLSSFQAAVELLERLGTTA